ncbi:MAG: hypothetical protein EAZ11_05255 [Curvibacter sp.]|nr:MAG: hypothetical protein EAZ11_05255 [Curvibacter sp.]
MAAASQMGQPLAMAGALGPLNLVGGYLHIHTVAQNVQAALPPCAVQPKRYCLGAGAAAVKVGRL